MENEKKRKNYFSNQGNTHKKRKGFVLECGMKGFLCTCNFREKDCVREAYNLLNEYAEVVYGPDDNKPNPSGDSPNDENKNGKDETEEVQEKDGTKVSEEMKPIVDEIISGEIAKADDTKAEKSVESNITKEDEEEDEDISDALNKELSELKAEAGKSPREKRFQVVDTGVTNVVFIKSTVPDALELMTKIIKDLDENKKQKTRYLLRMLPIQVVCKAYLDDIRSKADKLFEQYFSQEPKTFAIVFNRHSNNNLQRSDVIEDLAQIISKKNPGNKANLKSPDIAVVVEVVRAVCLISIAPQYFKYKKYNLLEICNQKEKVCN